MILPQLLEKIQHGVKKIECFMLFLCGDRKKRYILYHRSR